MYVLTLTFKHKQEEFMPDVKRRLLQRQRRLRRQLSKSLHGGGAALRGRHRCFSRTLLKRLTRFKFLFRDFELRRFKIKKKIKKN